jgi:uncharacterized membrane protein YeaQ/YmgE (transglycosylase-associated protein family)
MFHLTWYVVVGLVAGFVAQSFMHVPLPLFWTLVLGLAGSLVAGFVSHLLIRPRPGTQFHLAGLVFSIAGAVLVLLLWNRMNFHLLT